MTSRHSVFLLAAIFLGISCARADVELTAEERDNLGIETEAAVQVQLARSWLATAQVLDATPLVTTLGEIRAAETAVVASKSEAERSERLYREEANIARKAVDAALAQAATDAARLGSARAQLMGTWGHGIAGLAAPARASLVEDLLGGRVCLARVDLVQRLPASLREPRVAVRGLDGGEMLTARWLGRLPQAANTTLAGSGLLSVPAPLAAGSLLEARVSEQAPFEEGVAVPAGAVIRWHGAEWVYEETSTNHFIRRPVRSGPDVDGRALLAQSQTPNPTVVTVGARALLGAELGAAPSDEPGQGE